jgi:hypothetical protein
MMMMRILTAALVSSLTVQLSFGFQQQTLSHVSRVRMAATPSDEERAAALSNYMAKAHEEKLKAIHAAEAKKEAEIQDLKAQVKALQESKPAGSPASALTMTTTTGDMMDLSKEQLVNKIYQYQTFMKTYVVNAGEEKYRAVKAAEQSAQQKYKLLLGAGAGAAASAPVVLASPELASFASRNAGVAAAAAAGKSRWGDMEAQRAAVNVGASVVAAAPVQALPVPPEVLEADHGLRADGGVGGLTLAERVAMGSKAGGSGSSSSVVAPVAATATATTITITAPATAVLPAYAKRNARVLASAAAGKSRWGAMETEMIQKLGALPASSTAAVAAVTSQPLVVPAEVLEADHGLRADGGVGGLTLAERVAFGAKAGGSVSVVAPAATITNVLPSYTKRNARVVAAQAAGKSRWGPLETERIQKLVSLPAGSTDSPPAAGVNLGARLLAKK